MRVIKLLLSILAVVLCVTGAFAATTTYELVTPDENLSLGYSQGDYYKLGDLKVTATESFDTSYKVVVTVNREKAFTNQSADNSTLAYDLVISPDMTTITSGDSFDFSAASIDAGQGFEIGTKVTGDFLAAADGFYLDALTFKASLDNAGSTLSVGDTMTFGTFNSTAITWRVLSIDVTNNRALLITQQALEKRAYHSSYSSITWEGCSLRSYLNGDFLNNFTSAEQAKIVQVTNTNPDNPTYSTSGGSDTSDKMFLLSINEANTYFSSNDDRKCTLLSDNTDSLWWLRSPGNDDSYAAVVSDAGSVVDIGLSVDSTSVFAPPFG